MKLSVLFLLLLSFNVSAVDSSKETAQRWLERLSQSLRQLNFSASFVVVKNNQAEPYHWFHGVANDGQELEIITRLNGSRYDILRQGELISYIEPEQEPYSVISSDIRGPIPSVFRGDIRQLEKGYRFISVGRGRILGRVAQLVRIVAKDKNLHSYWLWLDQKTGLLLKMAVLTREGKSLEQIQFTHLEVTDQLSDNLIQLQVTELPKTISLTSEKKHKNFAWQVGWLPRGFKVVKSNRHQLNTYNQDTDRPVEFILLSDGLIELSVYVNPSPEKMRAPEYASDGATMVFNMVYHGVEVGVVGDIPVATAQRIAESIEPAAIDELPTISTDNNNSDELNSSVKSETHHD